MRRLTALAILCVCGIMVAWGWQATRFAQARATVLENPAANASLSAWNGVPGLTAEALERSSERPTAAALPAALRAAQIAALLAADPMSAQAWLSLAGDRLVLGHPASEIDAALTMSRITGPNEGAVMWQRGMFELVRWPSLSAAARRQAASDLAAALNGGSVNAGGISLAKAILAQQAPVTRADITTALAVAGLSERQLATIGLHADRG